MALPPNIETPRGLELQAKYKAAEAADPAFKDWPMPTKDDFALIGGIVVLFTYVEFDLRRLAETFTVPVCYLDRGRVEPWTSTLEMSKGLFKRPQCGRGQLDVEALKTLATHRRLRNLVAHFVVRRFPTIKPFFF